MISVLGVVMSLKACGHYLIVKLEPVDKEQVSDGGIVLAKTVKELNREQNAGQFAEVIDVGMNCWSVFSDFEGNWEPWCKPGDRVMVAQYAGQSFPVDDQLSKEEQDEASLMRLIKDDDVLAVEVNDE